MSGLPETAYSVLIGSCEEQKWQGLRNQLSASRFTLVRVSPGAGFLETVRRLRPEIAVIDLAPGCEEAVEMEIAYLKDLRPDVRIILLSEESSGQDAKLVEQGIFYYTSAPIGNELVQAIEAAADSISRKVRKHSL